MQLLVKEILPFFGHCDVTVFLADKYKKKQHFVFQTYLIKKRFKSQMAAVMLQVIPSFYTNYSKKLVFISANINEKNIVSKDYCFAHHDDKMCFLANFKWPNILKGDKKHLLEGLNACCSNYQRVVCLYSLFRYRFNCKNVVKSGQLFDKQQRAAHFNHQYKGVHGFLSITKKNLREQLEKQLLSSFQKNISTQTSGSVVAESIEQVKKTKFEYNW